MKIKKIKKIVLDKLKNIGNIKDRVNCKFSDKCLSYGIKCFDCKNNDKLKDYYKPLYKKPLTI